MTRIVFMGTPEFAVPVLEMLFKNYQVVAVYTRADKPAGRGKQVMETPVKVAARKHGLPIEQPRTLRNTGEQEKLRAYKPDLIVVAAYGLILPQAVLDIPPHGSINTHASLLPRWRGASPITFAILAGDAETGVTLMQMDAGLDTGAILKARAIPIAPEETTGTLTEKLSKLGAEMLAELLPEYLEGKITPIPQKNGKATMTRLVAKEDGLIDWNKPASEIERMVRAYNPWPSAFTQLHGEGLKIHRAAFSATDVPDMPGTVVQLGRQIGVATGEGVLILNEVQLAGKRSMSAEEFPRGQRRLVGAKLG